MAMCRTSIGKEMWMSLEYDMDKRDQDLVALLICGVWAAESTK